MGLTIDRRLSPCRGLCSTATFDDYCRGCGRSREQVEQWLTYSADKRIKIMEEIETRSIKMRGFPS